LFRELNKPSGSASAAMDDIVVEEYGYSAADDAEWEDVSDE
jgi:hypothetical protein